MIAKRIHSPKQTSSIKRLTAYIVNPAKQGELPPNDAGGIGKLTAYMDKPEAHVRISNCCFDSLREAVKEIQAVQKKNTRSHSEKTYHLMISFR